MKKQILKAFIGLVLAGGISSCGDSFLDTDYYKGTDVDTGLNSVVNISTALNGAYYQLFRSGFAGNAATTIGDIPTDISYWNTKTGHWDKIYQYTYLDTDPYLTSIWNYGYKVVDNSARIIQASNALYESSSDTQKTQLNRCMAEAYALRAFALLKLVNVYGHQVKVNGTDHSSTPGIVVIDEPIPAFTDVSRSTVGESYAAILSDLKKSIDHFTAADGDKKSLVHFSQKAVYGLLARTHLYLENWDEAIENAQKALTTAGITTLTYTPEEYKALYNTATSNVESMFALAITESQNWASNSCGTLWSTYNFSPSPKLLSLYGENDCRTSVFAEGIKSTDTQPTFNGGKFAHFSSGNAAYGTNYLINAPEMFLIIAEANLMNASENIPSAQEALLIVAKRNALIATISDLPATKDELMAFIKDERARELFQEGFRLFDLRRWDEAAEVFAYNAPKAVFTFTNYKISDLIFPIPNDEIVAGFGITQNSNWSDSRPKE